MMKIIGNPYAYNPVSRPEGIRNECAYFFGLLSSVVYGIQQLIFLFLILYMLLQPERVIFDLAIWIFLIFQVLADLTFVFVVVRAYNFDEEDWKDYKVVITYVLLMQAIVNVGIPVVLASITLIVVDPETKTYFKTMMWIFLVIYTVNFAGFVAMVAPYSFLFRNKTYTYAHLSQQAPELIYTPAMFNAWKY